MVAKLLLITLRHVVEMLNREGITWAIAGGVALSLWDHARSTKDADILLEVDDQDVDKMLQTFQTAGLRFKRHPPIVTVGEQRFVQFTFRPPETEFDIQVDFLLAEPEYQRRAMTRRLKTRFADWDVDVFVLACEDLIVFKLVAGRIIDIADAAALLRANLETIDFALLSAECQHSGVSDKLMQVWNEAFPNTSFPGETA